MIGDQEGKFREVFYNNVDSENTRIPKFGMYTGRTPYPGEKNKDEDKELAKTLANDLLNKEDVVKAKLIDIGKYPSKYKLDEYIDNLNDSKHITQDNDAELIYKTRNATNMSRYTYYKLLNAGIYANKTNRTINMDKYQEMVK